MKRYPLWCLVWCVLMIFAVQGVSAEVSLAGKVKTYRGSVIVERGGKTALLNLGDLVYKQDIIRTGRKSSVGVIFEDNSVLSLGPNSEILVDDYVFAPEKGLMAMVLRLVRGTASCISGIIGTQSPESVKFQTPDATIGIRGTHFLVEVDDGK